MENQEQIKDLENKLEKLRLKLWDLCHDTEPADADKRAKEIFELSKKKTELVEKLIQIQ